MDNTIQITSPTIKTDGAVTIMTNNLEVSFNDPQDKANFQAMISELNIGDSPQDQLYLLEAMCFAGVSYTID